MDKQVTTSFLFDISKDVRHFYESPVVFLTKTDFSDSIFNAMCSINALLIDEVINKDAFMDIVVEFHLQWLRSVNEIEIFKRRIIDDLTREEVYEAISFTIDGMSNRLKYFQRLMEKYRPKLKNEDQLKLNTDLEIVEEMHRDVVEYLLDTLKCLRMMTCDDEFKVKVNELVDQLLNWIDKIYDVLSLTLSNFTYIKIDEDLSKTLQQIVDEFHAVQTPSSQKILQHLKEKGTGIGSMICHTIGHDLEINKLVIKINILEDRISRLEDEQSSAVLALKNKKEYLQNRLESLENLKTTIKKINQLAKTSLEQFKDERVCTCEDFYRLRIFNHLLPHTERERLVTELCHLWDLAIHGERSRKSIISILSAVDIKQEYEDQLGTYFIDEHSRKIYKKPDDEVFYQPNENHVLVPLSDDSEHVYFYDECGRYYIDFKSRQRVYKAHATTSEYMMDSSGILLKFKEVRDGITYYYDSYGRYYINQEGQHIYRDEDSMSEYENDGLGNLVRIRSEMDIFVPCPDDVYVTEDFKFLKQTIGLALRQCIADVILRQPSDPIKYLSMRLVKYRENIELREKLAKEKEILEVERELKLAEERAAAERAAMEAALLTQGGSEASYDSNLIKYRSLHPDDTLSASASTK